MSGFPQQGPHYNFYTTNVSYGSRSVPSPLKRNPTDVPRSQASPFAGYQYTNQAYFPTNPASRSFVIQGQVSYLSSPAIYPPLVAASSTPLSVPLEVVPHTPIIDLSRIPHHKDVASPVQRKFNRADKNADGSLSEDEFADFLVDEKIIMAKNELRVLFLEVDKNGDGVLSKKEFDELVTRIKKIQDETKSVPLKTHMSSATHVFLGGSCNPTTWRKTIVMPMLEEHNVTYYNPQVDDWHAGLVELERKAKDSATILMFVIDDQTRAIVSMLEVAEFIGRGRHLVLTSQDIKPGTTIADTTLEQDEVDSLNEARYLVSDLARKSHLEFFSNVRAAATHIISLFNPNYPITKKCALNTPPAFGSVNFFLKGGSLFSKFDENKNGDIDHRELKLVFNHLGFQPSDAEIKKLFDAIDRNKDNRIDFEEFSSFLIYLAELQDQKSIYHDMRLSIALSDIFSKIRTYDSSNLMSRVEQTKEAAAFVYLGGSFSGNDWRKDVAIPALKTAKVSFFNPEIGRDLPSFSSIEWNGREKCSVFLFVISSDARCIKELAEAAYYIGLGRKVVLVVNDVKEGTRFGSKPVGTPELKDLNRGRAYLRESAKVASVPVFDDVPSAIQHIIRMAKK